MYPLRNPRTKLTIKYLQNKNINWFHNANMLYNTFSHIDLLHLR